MTQALTSIWTFIRRLNKYIDENEPWVLGKDESKTDILASVLYHLLEGIRAVTIMVSPFMTKVSEKIRKQIEISDGAFTWDSIQKFGNLPKMQK